MDSKSNAATDQSIDLICSPGNNNPKGVGRRLKKDDARIALLNYLQDATRSIEDPQHFYGFTFGLDELKKFIESIDRHNSDSATIKDDKIAGVRIYYSKAIRSNPAPPLIKGVMYPDLMLVPVLPSGVDYDTEVRPGKDKDKAVDPYILGDSRPCPNQCGFSFISEEK